MKDRLGFSMRGAEELYEPGDAARSRTTARSGRHSTDWVPRRCSASLQGLLDEPNAAQAEPLWPSAITSPINIDKTLLEPDAPDDEFIYWFN